MSYSLSAGVRYMLLGTLFFSVGSLLVKLAGEGVPAMQILFVRGVIGLGICWAILRRAGVGLLGHRRGLLLLRGILGFGALFTTFYAIVHLPLADAIVIVFSHPMLVAVLAAWLLGETMGRTGLIGSLISLAGVIIVCRPSFLFGGLPGMAHTPLDATGVWVALVSVVLTALAIIVVRMLAKTEHPASVMLYAPIVICIGAPFFAADWVWPTTSQWWLLAGVGLLMNGGQYYMTKGYAVESAGTISAVTYLEIVFTALLGVIFLDEIPDTWTIVGALLIIGGTVALGCKKQGD